MIRYALALCSLLLLVGCESLKTRAELRGEGQDPALQRQTVSQQREQAQQVQAPPPKPPPMTTAARLEEVDEQMRQLNGRVDTVENHLNQHIAGQQNDRETIARERQVFEQRLIAYEEALKTLEAQVKANTEELARLKAPPAPAPAASAPGKTRTAYDEGEELFNAKKWKEAIVAYQKYRDTNGKGKMYPDATYKMGVSFQELGMKDEAKAFYEEVRDKFPNSKEAKKASVRMKSLK